MVWYISDAPNKGLKENRDHSRAIFVWLSFPGMDKLKSAGLVLQQGHIWMNAELLVVRVNGLSYFQTYFIPSEI